MQDYVTRPGTLRGLQAVAGPTGVFAILALDHGDSFRAALRPEAPTTISDDLVSQGKSIVMEALASHASGVLLDPSYGLGPAIFGRALPGHVGLLVSVEDGDYANPSAREPARLLDGWSVALAKRVGAAAAKFFFYYDPADVSFARAQETVLAQVVTECRRHDLPLFAEPVVLGAPSQAAIVETARRISQLGVDVLKSAFPADVNAAEPGWPEGCRAMTQVCACPWVVLSGGAPFDLFRRQVLAACQAGASGFVAGRAIWGPAVGLSGSAQVAALSETAAPRLSDLTGVVRAHGRPWFEAWPALPSAMEPGWHRRLEAASPRIGSDPA